MLGHELELAARQVLDQFRFVSPADSVRPLGNLGGFSGAALWRVEGGTGPLCLRAWPPRENSAEHLAWIHHWMQRARASGLQFVPAAFATVRHATVVEHAGRLWDLTAWMPGRADFHERPTPERLQAASTALALLHVAWAKEASQTGRCPALARRQELVHVWSTVAQATSGLLQQSADPAWPWAQRARSLLLGRVDWVTRALAPWTDRHFTLHPCLCDIWHDHVLFEGDTVSGLIDYGGLKIDHPAVDLARMLGSLIEDDEHLWEIGLDAYSRVQPLATEERGFIRMLDQTGTVLGMVTWLKWLYCEGRAFENRQAAADRLAKLVERVEGWRK
ncbi:MAG TPA: phosphotransferase [Gemmataceae bacterium]|nr:phosphotransferase [Gemmataceae bacterium]